MLPTPTRAPVPTRFASRRVASRSRVSEAGSTPPTPARSASKYEPEAPARETRRPGVRSALVIRTCILHQPQIHPHEGGNTERSVRRIAPFSGVAKPGKLKDSARVPDEPIARRKVLTPGPLCESIPRPVWGRLRQVLDHAGDIDMAKPGRKIKKANHGKRPASSKARKEKRQRIKT